VLKINTSGVPSFRVVSSWLPNAAAERTLLDPRTWSRYRLPGRRSGTCTTASSSLHACMFAFTNFVSTYNLCLVHTAPFRIRDVNSLSRGCSDSRGKCSTRTYTCIRICTCLLFLGVDELLHKLHGYKNY
jgi:hypothetical protein